MVQEPWLSERQAYGERLEKRAHRIGSQTDIAEWERFVRQTARMAVVAEQLRTALSEAYSVANGIRLRFQGKEIYLEHLVIGPTGIYLVESAEDNPDWRDDLARSLAFFQANLGSEQARFTALVIARELTGSAELPAGAHLVDSLAVAVAVMRDERSGDPLPSAVAQELGQIIEALRVREPMRPEPEPRRFAWRDWVTVGAMVGFDTLMVVEDPSFTWSDWLIGLLILVAPTAGLVGLTLLLPAGRVRRAVSYTLMAAAVTFLLIMWLGSTVEG